MGLIKPANFLTKIKKICSISYFCDYTVPELIIGGGNKSERGGGAGFIFQKLIIRGVGGGDDNSVPESTQCL